MTRREKQTLTAQARAKATRIHTAAERKHIAREAAEAERQLAEARAAADLLRRTRLAAGIVARKAARLLHMQLKLFNSLTFKAGIGRVDSEGTKRFTDDDLAHLQAWMENSA